MLALQTLLSGKERIPTLVFDEIDANIGGETAVVVGDKLKQIGRKHQVLCITHFPQVAKQADHHLQISKQEKAGRTVTMVLALDAKTKERELIRMLGG
jgi:DNA repair protein RecN (Recombination protein N)